MAWTARKFEITDQRHGAAFTVRVTPRSRQAVLNGIQEDGVLNVGVTAAAPGEAAANAELVDLLAYWLHVPRAAVEIVAGREARHKLVSIDGLKPGDLEARLAGLGNA